MESKYSFVSPTQHITLGKRRFMTSTLVQFLVDYLPKKVVNGCNTTDFHGASGTVVGQGGWVYEVEIRCCEMRSKDAGSVKTVEMSKIYSDSCRVPT